ncbi:MAG: hypothetical protein K0R31_2389, partial [Clostridiales bacterium]|nr:hypothetical protein [Clostridiales bacterium]
EGFNISKQVVVISQKPNDIINYIILKLNRDATIYKAVGAYSNEEKQVVTTILSRRETVKLRRFIRSLDDKAFITITNTSEIIGKGFRNVDM